MNINGSTPKRRPYKENVLSFVACAHDGSFPELPNGNDSNEIIYKQIDNAGRRVEKAAGLADIVKQLANYAKVEERVDVIQIIGHGTPGMLSLAYAWDKRYADDNGRAFVLDSNPYAHGLLAYSLQPFIRENHKPKVLLLGCQVGSNDRTAYLARGSSLIFDLHKMWECYVAGAVDIIGPSDFVDGRFEGRLQGYLPDGKGGARWRKAKGSAPPVGQPDRARSVIVKSARVTAAPAMGLLDMPERRRTIDAMMDTIREFTEPVRMKHPPLAMAELVLAAKLENDQEVKAEMLGNGTLLRIVIDKQVVYLRRPGENEPAGDTPNILRRAAFDMEPQPPA